MPIHEILGTILIIFGIVFQLFGTFYMWKNKNFYVRLSISSLVDSAGFITILIGLMFYKGLSFASLKIFIILCLVLLLNPVTNHVLGRCAFLSNYHPEKE